MSVALQLALALRSSVSCTSTTVGTLAASSMDFVVHRNVDPPRCGEAVSGLLTLDVTISLPSIFTEKSKFTVEEYLELNTQDQPLMLLRHSYLGSILEVLKSSLLMVGKIHGDGLVFKNLSQNLT